MTRLHSMLLALVVTALPISRARADTCTPDYSQEGSLFGDDTDDPEILVPWCYSGSLVSHYWHTLNLGHMGSYWFTYTNNGQMDCQPNNYLVRLLNGPALMDQAHHALANTTLAQAAYDWRDDIIVSHNTYSYVASCDPDPVAANPVDWGPFGHDPTILYYPFFWKLDVVERASTLVHESLHDIWDHADGPCPRCGTSCDWSYDDPNGNVTQYQIAFLADMITAYVRDPNGDELLVVNYGNDVCGYLPFLSEVSRGRAYTHIQNKLNNCFVYGSSFGPARAQASVPQLGNYTADDFFWNYGGVVYQTDKANNARWPCAAVCLETDYQAGGAHYCNEAYQAANVEINQQNLESCIAANAQIGQGVTPSQRQQVANALSSSELPCVPGVSQDFLGPYCSGLAASAANVAAIESGWTVPDQPGYFDSGDALLSCVQTYCDGKFDNAWVAPARAACYEWSDSTYGCLDAVCGSLSEITTDYGAASQQYFQAVQCRRSFIEHSGNPASYYDDPHTKHTCQDIYLSCLNAKAYDPWKTARDSGSCSLTTPNAAAGGYLPVRLAMQNPSAVASVGSLSYAAYNAAFPDSDADDCMMQEKLCNAGIGALTAITTEIVSLESNPWAHFGPGGGPTPPDGDKLGIPVDDAMRWQAKFSLGSTALGSFTPEDAMGRLAQVPELRHALARAIGEQNYFAAFGTAGQESVFGKDAVAQFAAAELLMPTGASSEMQTAMASLAAAIPTRQRCESPETQALLARAGTSMAASDLYGQVQAAANLHTLDGVNGFLDALAATVGP